MEGSGVDSERCGVYRDIDVSKIMKILPHRYPFLLLDRVECAEPFCVGDGSGHVRAYKNVTINEQIFLGHFPKDPVYPGVMIIEGMAQAGCVLAFVSSWGFDFDAVKDKVVYFMTIDGAKFRAPVRPGDRLYYDIKVSGRRSNVWKLRGESLVDGRLVCEANFMAMVIDNSI